MKDFKQNIISVRFLEVIEDLINKRIVDNMTDFCKKVDYTPQSMSQIKGGKRDVTVELISKLFSVFKGNPIYILSGKGDKILNDQALTLVEESQMATWRKDDKITIQTLEQLVDSKNDIIALLKKENVRLDQELKKRVS